MKIALGTVQFGLDYGVTNSSGKVSFDECKSILKTALHNGINTFDTAAAYGNSEKVLGSLELANAQKIITKIPSLENIEKPCLIKTVKESLIKLKRETLSGLLLHREDDLLGHNSDLIYKQLQQLKNEGLVDKIGVSFYSVEAAKIIAKKYSLDIVQLPANILDRRFEQAGVISMFKEQDVEVHVRSLFLQGLLAIPANARPLKFKKQPELLNFDKHALSMGVSSLELSLLYLIKTTEIDFGVVGCVKNSQLLEIIKAYEKINDSDLLLPNIISHDLNLLNPSTW